MAQDVPGKVPTETKCPSESSIPCGLQSTPRTIAQQLVKCRASLNVWKPTRSAPTSGVSILKDGKCRTQEAGEQLGTNGRCAEYLGRGEGAMEEEADLGANALGDLSS
jgi:hypothetical protein